jgi:hypothetical protein
MIALRGWGAMVAPGGASDEMGYKTADALEADGSPRTNAVNFEVREQMKLAVEDTLRGYFPEDFPASNVVGPSLPQTKLTYRFDPSEAGSTDRPALRSFDMRRSSVRLQLEYRARTLLMGAIRAALGSPSCQTDPDDGSYRCAVRSAFNGQSGFLRPANIFLLLDTSGSMAASATTTGGSSKSKIEVLKEATGSFIDMFNPYKDRIAVIDFGTSVKNASQLQNFSAADSGGSGHLAIKTRVRTLQPGGQTNPGDALLNVIEQSNGLAGGANASSFVLIFTDGAPNVYRLNFSNAPRLNSVSVPDNSRGWFGWTVKWGEREISRDVRCPSTNPRDCDPVWGWPQVNSATRGMISLAEIQANLRVNQDGEFVWKTSTPPGWSPLELAPGGPYRLSWKPKTTAEDNYKWYGPSYLVHGSETIPASVNLIDRIPRLVKPNPITCGTGSRNGYPGNRQLTMSGPFTDMYNHSRYFASRVVNANWRLDSSGSFQGARSMVGLGLLQATGSIAGPEYFAKESSSASSFDPPSGSRQPMDFVGGASNPGCLNSLNAALPGFRQSNGQPDNSLAIIVGRDDITRGNLNPSIVANTSVASVGRVGEVVKTAELPYYAAIRAADFLRRNRNMSIFAVGLGPSATFKYGAQCNDPLQNALDFDSRKDGFLRRLAFAPESLANPRTFMRGGSTGWNTSTAYSDFTYNSSQISQCSQHPLSGEQVTRGYSHTIQGAGEPALNSPAPTEFTKRHLGAYYGSNDSSQVKALFGKVAKEMLLRLSN